MTKASFNKNSEVHCVLEFKKNLEVNFGAFPVLKTYLEGSFPKDLNQSSACEWQEQILDFVNSQLELAQPSKYEEEGLFLINSIFGTRK